MDEKKQIVYELLAHQLDKDLSDISEESRLKEDLWADSLDEMEIKVELENKFSIEIPEEDLDKFKTVGDILNYLDQH